jgi:hypothetical protein
MTILETKQINKKTNHFLPVLNFSVSPLSPATIASFCLTPSHQSSADLGGPAHGGAGGNETLEALVRAGAAAGNTKLPRSSINISPKLNCALSTVRLQHPQYEESFRLYTVPSVGDPDNSTKPNSVALAR